MKKKIISKLGVGILATFMVMMIGGGNVFASNNLNVLKEIKPQIIDSGFVKGDIEVIEIGSSSGIGKELTLTQFLKNMQLSEKDFSKKEYEKIKVAYDKVKKSQETGDLYKIREAWDNLNSLLPFEKVYSNVEIINCGEIIDGGEINIKMGEAKVIDIDSALNMEELEAVIQKILKEIMQK